MSDFLDDFFGAGNDINPATLDAGLQALLDNWQAAIRGGRIGFLPRLSQQRTIWYSFAPTPRQRRELLELLDAWVGPTHSDLAIRRGELDTSDVFDAALGDLDVPPLRCEVLPTVAPESAKAKESVRNALATLTRLSTDRPASQFDAMRTTVEILDDLGHAIAVQDRELADACMTELEQSADLDESNLAFLRLRLHAGMQDWAAIFADPALDHVLSMRRPLGVTRVIQQAVYFELLHEFDREGAGAELRNAAEQLQPGLRDLYTGSPPDNRPETIVELVCRLLVTPAVDEPAVTSLIAAASSIEPGLGDHCRYIVEGFVQTRSVAEPGFEIPGLQPLTEQPASGPMAHMATLIFNGEYAASIDFGLQREPSVEVGRALVYAARQLSSVEWASRVIDYLDANGLRDGVSAAGPVIRADVEWLESVCGELLRGWKEWFANLDDPNTGPLHAPGEANQSWEPLSATEFTALMTNASESALAKLGERGGQFLAAHSDLFAFEGGAAVTLRVIAAMALGSKASAGVRVQTLALLEALGATGSSQETFEEVLDWTIEIMDANIAATTVSWATDVLQTLTSIPAPGSGEAVLSFYYKAIEALRPYRTALDVIDIEALEVVAAELSTVVPAEFRVAVAETAGEDPGAAYRHLEGKTVVLHSLTETAITRASQVLKRLVPSIDIRTNSDHDGSTQLAQLSANADVFVVVTAAAKHAATTFIADHRHDLPTVFVNSRGSSAILRALAD